MAFAVFLAVIDQSGLVCGQVRPQFGQTLANLFDDRRSAGILLCNPHVNIDSIVKATQGDAGSVQVAMPDLPLRAIQVMPVSRQPVFEILDMRKVDEAFSDSLKVACDVIPIQDVLLVSVEHLAHQRPHAVLTIGDNAQLGLKVSSPLP